VRFNWLFMFNNIIEFIQNSVTTVVGLTVGVLGIGTGDFNPQDTSLSTEDVEISESLSEDSGIFSMFDSDSQVADISGALQSVSPAEEVVKDDAGDSGAVAVAVISTDEVDGSISVFTQETELTRTVNPIKSTKITKEVDASLILKTDFDKFNFNLQITKITEDDNSFYSTYQFHSFAIKGKTWEKITKENQISVTKAVLDKQDLGDYLSEELGEVVDSETIFLKEVQVIHRAKLAEAKAEEIAEQDGIYSALIGKVLDIDGEEFGDYESIEIDEEEGSEIIASIEEIDEEIIDNTTDAGVIDNEAPLVIIQGNNPALIQIGSSYSDLGAKVTDDISDNLDVKVGGDVVETSVKGSYFITYTAVDEAGNVATATREVIVYDYGAVPEVEQVEPPVVEEEIEEEIEEIEEIDEIEEVEQVDEVEEIEDEIEIPIVEEDDEEVSEEIGEEVATTTNEVVEENVEENTASVVETVVETVVEVAEEATEVVAEVADIVVENVIEGSKKVGKKVKKVSDAVGGTAEAVIETVSETTEAVIETVADTTTETIEQISEVIEVVAEEVSAMIKAVHFMELISNIRSTLQASIVNVGSLFQSSVINVGSVLQASVSTTGDGANSVVGVAKSIGQFFKATGNDIVRGVSWTVDKSQNFIQKYWQKFGLGEAISEVSTKVTASVNSYRNDLDGEDESKYQKQSFIGFIFRKIIETPKIILNKIINTTTGLTATVKNYSRVVSSDLEIVGEQIDKKIDEISFSPKGIIQSVRDTLTGAVSNVFNFFKNHRPL